MAFLIFAKDGSDLRSLIEAGVDVNAADKQGMTALMFAARDSGDPELLRNLISAGADVNAKDKLGKTVLMIAARHNSNPEVIRVLIEAGAKPNEPIGPILDNLEEIKKINNIKSKKVHSDRKNAIKETLEEIQEQFDIKELTKYDMITAIEEHLGDVWKYLDGYSDKELLEAYKQIKCLYIGDEGEMHEKEEPYAVNDIPFCCGRLLEKYKGGLLKCSACGGKYEAEYDEDDDG